jgi:hypothetical protein
MHNGSGKPESEFSLYLYKLGPFLKQWFAVILTTHDRFKCFLTSQSSTGQVAMQSCKPPNWSKYVDRETGEDFGLIPNSTVIFTFQQRLLRGANN